MTSPLGREVWIQVAEVTGRMEIHITLCPQLIVHTNKIKVFLSWLVWLSGLSANLQTKGSPVQSPVRAQAWVAGQVPSGVVHERQATH